MTQSHWDEMLGEWRATPGPLYARLAGALRSAIERGALAPGASLPPERTLATDLFISRSTLAAALAQLRADGFVDSRQGSGTRVLGPRDRRAPHNVAVNPFTSSADALPDVIAFTLAKLPAPARVRIALRAAATDAALDALLDTHGYATYGIPELREAIAAHYTRWGLPTAASQVLVTSGAQQAVALTAQLALSPGADAIVEDPTYSGALDAFASTGARMVPLAVRDHGAHADELEALLARHAPALVYLIPTHHNPTGTLMSEPARRRVARLIARSGTLLAEDLALSHVSVTGAAPLPISAFAPEAPAIAIDSISKSCWGGLRIGWIRSSEELVERLARLKSIADLSTPILSQLAGARLVGELPAAHAEVRELLLPRLELLSGLIAELLPSWSWTRPVGGLALWVRLPAGSAIEFAQVARQHGVAIVAGPSLSPSAGQERWIRLAYVLDERRLTVGVRRLAAAWTAYERVLSERRSVGVLV